MTKKILKSVEQYYSQKISEHGATSQGVDWNGRESQFLRFEQLSKVIASKSDFSVLDFGCGYGSFIEFLNENEYHDYNYLGYDISAEMIKEANAAYSEENIKFTESLDAIGTVDYTIASGIFNVKLETGDDDWKLYIEDTLRKIDEVSSKGFSFNILTSFSDEEYKKDYLFYAEPMYYFNLCKDSFSRNVALLHDYNLYEFTIIVRK